MSTLTKDANGHEIVKTRGLRVCASCGLVISEGYTDSDGGGVCSEACLAKVKWGSLYYDDGDEMKEVIIDRDDIVGLALAYEKLGGVDAYIFWSDWEGNEHNEDALERLLTAPYNWTPDEIKSLEEENA